VKTYSNLFLLFIAVSVLASCGGNSQKDNADSAKRADSVKAVFKMDSLKKDVLLKDSIKMDSIAKVNAAPTKASDPAQLEKDIKAEKVKVFFEGFGTEPFWTIYITKYELLKVDEGVNTRESYLLVNQFDSKLKKQTITYKDGDGNMQSVVITRGNASPGMGPDIYPYSIHLGPTLDGAGDTLFIKDDSKYARDLN
jgi:uncharacterized membrane protein